MQDIDKIHLYVEDPFGRGKVEIEELNPKVFVEYSRKVDV